ncbi:MAG: translation initiation factor IF-2 subunit beta [archaeon]|jgi:translation initiation factor 2 subunit 2|nr:translation initiation factor IF-2 subunit beta [archaeon]MDD2477753.1 translation initiation factor IF-2 subunit beta [Candidatus ainarchaeum sp.]MDD3084624.1 translation initiation factor IF-2 subunit beta [Candidatus ainarchaeum sp.]MDD4221330.1 translation initiation factor IF-2 subunit beta [Candidatus ainarchaeum sp.]MDD4662839.1 translation initiation factor IF-2 subunit beta [Candidatus ainarchaeum sp.]
MSKEETSKDLDYKTLLDRIYMSLPERTLSSSRFELPRAESMLQGKQTIWKNFSKVAKDLKRDENQLYKFVMKEISTSSAITNGTLVLNGIFNNYKINLTLDKYIKNFVLCSACKKPDTDIVSQNGVKVLKCSACGAITPLPKI